MPDDYFVFNLRLWTDKITGPAMNNFYAPGETMIAPLLTLSASIIPGLSLYIYIFPVSKFVSSYVPFKINAGIY